MIIIIIIIIIIMIMIIIIIIIAEKSVIVRVKNRLAAWKYKTKDFYRLRVPTLQNEGQLLEEAVLCYLLFSLLTFNYCLVSSRPLIHSTTFDDAKTDF